MARSRSSANRLVGLIMYGIAAVAIVSGVTTLNGPHSHFAGLLAWGAIVVGTGVGIGALHGSRSR